MAEKKEEKKTIFRRIGGRIVPISVGVGSIAAGRRLDVEKHGMKLHQKSLATLEKITDKHRPAAFQADQSVWNKYFTHEGRKMKALKNIYGPELKKFNTTLQMNPSKHSYFSPNGIVSPYISLRTGNASTFLHELGHAEQKFKKVVGPRQAVQNVRWKAEEFVRNKIIKPTYKRSSTYKNYASASSLKYSVGSHTFKQVHPKWTKLLKAIEGNQSRTHILFESGIDRKLKEVGAWGRAFKFAKTPKMKLDVVKTAVPALGTYLAKDVVKLGKTGLIAGGVGAVAYGLFKKDKKK